MTKFAYNPFYKFTSIFLEILSYTIFFITTCAYADVKTIAIPTLPSGSIIVTPENYIRAETDLNFSKIIDKSGGINKFYHFRKPITLDQQTLRRMNKDTLYSTAIVDTDGGATITLPNASDGRYVSALIIDNDHYIDAVFHEPGTHKIPSITKYVFVIVRIQVFNPNDRADISIINQLQDKVIISAKSATPWVSKTWDNDSLNKLTAQYQKEAEGYSSFKGLMGERGQVVEKRRHVAVAAAWGLNPDQEATYLNYRGTSDDAACYTATYTVPKNRAFWSITIYDNQGYMTSNNNYINQNSVKYNNDGSFTLFFGSEMICGNRQNRLDVTPGWNFLMRVYLPDSSVINGDYKLPEVNEAEYTIRAELSSAIRPIQQCRIP